MRSYQLCGPVGWLAGLVILRSALNHSPVDTSVITDYSLCVNLAEKILEALGVRGRQLLDQVADISFLFCVARHDVWCTMKTSSTG